MNNVVVKFVEDDMVLSINMKSAECFSVNHLWEKTYMDIGNLQQQQQQQPSAEFRLQSDEHHVRKILQLNDVTICLDKLDSRTNNKISFYQDPLIYRCSIQSRLDFKFSSNLNLNNIDQQLKLIKLNLYCRKFDMSITDKQLPMLIRLIELIIAISYGTLKLPESSGSSSSSSDLTFEHSDTMNASNQLKPNLNPASLNPTIISELKANDEQLSLDISNDLYTQQQQHQQQQQGWLSWAWSYVPSVSDLIPDGGEENVPTAAQLETLIKDPIQTIIGFYFDELNIAFKLTQQVNHDHHQSSKAYAFEPFVVCSMKGIAFESNLKQNFAHLLLGVSFINLRSMGSCCCRLCPKPTENEIVFLRAGSDYLEEKTFHYMSGSLFDIIEESLAMSNEEVLVNSTDNSSTKIDSAVFKPPVDLSSDKFTKLFVTVHPFGVEGDIPGKCSNSNYGIRSLFKHLKEENPHLDTSDYILTNFDVDTVFHKNFLDILNLSILENEKDLAKIVFQPLLYYNWNLDKLSFFTRIIGVLRVNSIFFIKTTKNLFILYHGSIFNFQRAQ